MNYNNKKDTQETNKQLIKYIYDVIENISYYKYELLKCESQLSKFISKTKYYLAPNLQGKNCYLVFTKIEGMYYSFLVEKKQLSFSYDKIDFKNLQIYHYNIQSDLSIYDGTIFDGIQNKRNDYFEFLITDVYQFKGANCVNDKLQNKLFEVELYLKSVNYDKKLNINKINSKYRAELKLSKLYDIFDIETFISNELKNYEKNYQVKGLCFYPEISGTKLFFCFDTQNNGMKTENKQKIIIQENKQLLKSKTLVKKEFVSTTSNDIFAILEMKTMHQPDNYKLYALETCIINGITKLKKCQMDIAYIPNIEKSKWCREITNSKDNIFVKCIWRNDKKKFEPFEVADVKLPSLIDDIKKKMIEIEIDNTDDED